MLKGNLVAYSGMTTKIRAMKNKLLSPEQYEEITHFTTVAELISFLLLQCKKVLFHLCLNNGDNYLGTHIF